MAFAAYRAPADFTRAGTNDLTASERSVFLTFTSDKSTNIQDKEIKLMRPPVVFIHGLWGSRLDWVYLEPLFRNMFYTEYVDYSRSIGTITDTTPPVLPDYRQRISGSALGFHHGALHVLPSVRYTIRAYSKEKAVACAKADIVAHSMGGLVARQMQYEEGYFSQSNYRMGLIHKLITVGTPHIGSPLATQLLLDSNQCVRGLFSSNLFKNLYSLHTAITTAGEYSGGVADLRGKGDGTEMSSALRSLRPLGKVILPTALISGVLGDQARLSVDCTFCGFEIIRQRCPSDPITTNLTNNRLYLLFGGESDGIVPTNSSTDFLRQNAVVVVGAHSEGTVSLGFGGESVMRNKAVFDVIVERLKENYINNKFFYNINQEQ